MPLVEFSPLLCLQLPRDAGVGPRSPRQKKRLDVLAVERGLAESRQRARALVMAGEVLVDGRVATRPAELVAEDVQIAVREPLPYVSRGGVKLAHALDCFQVDPQGKTAVDIGASTGGFTDVLLKRGAKRVYAVDVGYGQLDWRLRNDPRVSVLERTNVRTLQELPEAIELAVIDVSFISLKLVLPAARRFLRSSGEVVALVKPQFEAGREQVGKGGVVRDPSVHRQVLQQVAAAARELGFGVMGVAASPLLGPAGNREFLVHLRLGVQEKRPLDGLLERALAGGGLDRA